MYAIRSYYVAHAQEALPGVVGWVEQAMILPENVPVTIKMDTGALTSSMDAQALRRFDRNGKPWVSYDVQAKDRLSGRMTRLHFERPVLRNVRFVITSYSIHYTKLYEASPQPGSDSAVRRQKH